MNRQLFRILHLELLNQFSQKFKKSISFEKKFKKIMIKMEKIFLMLLILTSCSNEPNDNNENITHNKQEFNLSSIIGKWKLTDSNPILEGEIISEYFEDDTFKQNGVIKSFQPSYTCQMSSNGTFSFLNNTLSYSYLAESMFDFKPESFQLMVNSYMGNKELETSENRILKLDDKVMIQENLLTKKILTFERIIEK
jgi:hypothetical protein